MPVIRLVHTTAMLAVMVVAKRQLTGLSICESIWSFERGRVAADIAGHDASDMVEQTRHLATDR